MKACAFYADLLEYPLFYSWQDLGHSLHRLQPLGSHITKGPAPQTHRQIYTFTYRKTYILKMSFTNWLIILTNMHLPTLNKCRHNRCRQ